MLLEQTSTSREINKFCVFRPGTSTYNFSVKHLVVARYTVPEWLQEENYLKIANMTLSLIYLVQWQTTLISRSHPAP